MMVTYPVAATASTDSDKSGVLCPCQADFIHTKLGSPDIDPCCPRSRSRTNADSKSRPSAPKNATLFFFKCLLVVNILCSQTPRCSATEGDLFTLINRLNGDVIELRNEIEQSILRRCDSIRGCFKSSYDECQSEYTANQICPSFDELGFAIDECGAGVNCNGLFDKTITTVRIPRNLALGPNKNPTNPNVVQSVCYTRTAEQWMVDKSATDAPFWESLGVDSPQMYYGSSMGTFRIHPARHSRACGEYDPRTRPWYKAAVPTTISKAVTPRRLVIVMDTSRSMLKPIREGLSTTKLSYMKSVVKSTLSLLSSQDSVAVVRFGERASLVGRPGAYPPYLWQDATSSNIDRLSASVDAIEVLGRSNWVEGFNFAFDLIDNSLDAIAANDDTKCEVENIALLFFTDGLMNMPEGVTDEDVVDLVSSRLSETKSKGEYQVHSFFYSLGNSDLNQVAKKISCAVDGFWKPVSSTTSPGNVTNGYQTLFSTPLSTNFFYNFTAWSDPYIFASTGREGYTVSALVYDRDVAPPRFQGAVGMDVSVDAVQRLHGGTIEEAQRALKKITTNITSTLFAATCEQGKINLTYCETQSIRHFAGGDDSICIPPPMSNDTLTPANQLPNQVASHQLINCSNAFVNACPGLDEYPTDLWKNVNLQDDTFQERVCCRVGTNTVSDQCPQLDVVRDTLLSDEAIFGIMFASIAVTELIGCYLCFYYRKKKRKQDA